MDALLHRDELRRGDLLNDFGLELRVEHGGEPIEFRLSRYGIEPLLLIAVQIKANLIAQG